MGGKRTLAGLIFDRFPQLSEPSEPTLQLEDGTLGAKELKYGFVRRHLAQRALKISNGRFRRLSRVCNKAETIGVAA
jgi:hypothetical protein